MNTLPTCATCSAFNAVRAIPEPGCWHHVSFVINSSRSRDPGPDDLCDLHQTNAEQADQSKGGAQ